MGKTKGVDFEAIFKQLGIKKEDLEESIRYKKSLKILVTGKAGTGKSTIINGILGMQTAVFEEKAKVEHRCDRPGTFDIEPFMMTKGDIIVTVWDSRGVLDDTDEKEQDACLKKMVSECSDADLKLLCVNMNETKFYASCNNPHVMAMIKIVEAFAAKKKNFWENAIVVFTFANMVLKKNFKWKFAEFEHQMREIIHTYGRISETEASKIQIVPAGYYEERDLPGREYWLSSLWVQCLLTIPDQAAQKALITVNQDRFTTPENVELTDLSKPLIHQPIVLSPSMVENSDFISTVFKVLGCAAGGAVSGGAIGTAAIIGGPIGAAIGVPAGALMGFCVGLALGVHKVQEANEKKKVHKVQEIKQQETRIN